MMDPDQNYSESAIPRARSPSPSPAIPRRTNSLAFEKSDCHICAKKSRKCGRQRRECRTCESLGDTCTGYPVRLQWQDGSASSTWHLNSYLQTPAPTVDGQSASQTATSSSTTRPFKFVGNKPRKPRKSRKPKAPDVEASKARRHQSPIIELDVEQATSSATLGSQDPELSVQTHFPDENLYDPIIHDAEPLLAMPEAGNFDSHDPINWTMLDTPMSGNQSQDLLDFSNYMSTDLQEIPNFHVSPKSPITSQYDLDPIAIPNKTGRPTDRQNEGNGEGNISPPEQSAGKDPENEQLISSGVLDQNTTTQAMAYSQLMRPPLPAFALSHDRFSGLLDMYDRVFCIYPVTGAMAANPFRVRDDTSSGSLYLLHAIVALSIHHLGRQIGDNSMDNEVADHKDTAIQLYVNAIQSPRLRSIGPALLDTAVILFALDATNSAFGDWNKQLKRVKGLLEMFGGPEALRHSSRVRAQVAMFLWWDTTLSLLSRKTRIIPSSYYTVLCSYTEQDPWKWFDLVGCPAPLVACLIELSDLVAEYEKTCKMRWSRFDTSRVLAIEQFLKGWFDQQFADIEGEGDDEEVMQYKRDCYHCTEAWRNALLIYILRIFKPEDLPRSPHAMSYRSRVTLDHVRCCRKTTNVQKQLLLPVFLAACEASSPDARVWAKEYCTWWNDKSAYGMFSSVVSLMAVIWARQLIEGKDNLWWGQVIDDKCDGSSTIQCLLG